MPKFVTFCVFRASLKGAVTKVSEQFSPTLYLPCQEPLTGSSWTQAGPQTTQELHCPGMYAAAWLLACKGVVRWGGQNPGGLLSAISIHALTKNVTGRTWIYQLN